MDKLLLRGFGVFGVLLFLPLFSMTFADPQLVEKSGKSFIEWKLQSEVNTKIDSLKLPESAKLASLLGARAKELRAKTEAKLAIIKAQLKADTPAILAAEIAKLSNLDCTCRKKWEKRIRISMEARVVSLEAAKSKIIDFTHVKYMNIVQRITLDVRIFLGANSVVFIFLLLASFLQPKVIKQLFLPGSLLLISTVICSYFYLFEQNWFYTIIYNSYTGFAYLGYLLLIFAILCDIIFNKARITTKILNVFLNVIGAALSIVSC